MTDKAGSPISSRAPSGGANYSATDVALGDGGTRKIYYRPNTTDVPVINHTISEKKYDIRRLQRFEELQGFLSRQRAGGKTPLVVDAGANIGVSALFFANALPDATVVAIEPDAENFRLLEMNVQGLRVESLHAAVSSTPGLARVVDPGIGHWGYRTENLADNAEMGAAVPRRTINEFYRKYSEQCFPFIVKIDIEGGEADVFSANTDWVAVTPILIIELHDWLMPKSGNSRAFLQCISRLDRDFVYIGEDVYSIANDLG